MTAPFEELILSSGGPGAELLSPGAVQRALALGAGVRADEVGLLTPLGRGAVAVEVALTRALTIATPRLVPVADAEALYVLRRPDDPVDEGRFELLVAAEDDGDPPGPGALANAFAVAAGLLVGAEDLGVGFAGPCWVRVSLPGRVLAATALPATLDIGARRFRVQLADGGKKNP